MVSRDSTDNHMIVTIPVELVREVLGRDHPRHLLLHLAEAADPVRYSEARRDLGLHPQQFQRALDTLEENGLVGLEAPDDLNADDADRDYYVFLEPTGLGSLVADLWERMNQEFSALAREYGVSADALGAAATGE